ncbi:MAG: anti-sigma factor [Alphaproteobacteria bacterium]|nr:anti-sigma factor [Alphaproteobacteria bacterium]
MITEAQLMAYVDGELSDAERASVEAAIAADPDLRKKCDAHRAVRARLSSAFAPIADEPVPERLIAAARASQAPAVIDFAAAKQNRARLMTQIAALAATFFVGIVLGAGALRGGSDLYANEDGLVARGALAHALDTQLASAGAAPIRIGLTFTDQDGGFCRTFAAGGDEGLACRDGGDWRIAMLERTGADPEMRMVSSSLVLQAVEARIEGDVFDQPAERAARDAGWRNDPSNEEMVPPR